MATLHRIGFQALLLLLVAPITFTFDQSQELTIRLRRHVGSSLAGQMQGSFSMIVSGPDNLIEVEFLIDDQVIGKDDEEPFQFRFNTGDFGEGLHSLRATGLTSEGLQLRSDTLRRQFVSGRSVFWIVGGIVVLVIGFRVISSLVVRRKGTSKPASSGYGLLGGAVCPKCDRPFARHWWGLNLFAGRLDRCPHCKRWSMVQGASTVELSEAEEVDQVSNANDLLQDESNNRIDEIRKKLEESRFDDH